MTAQALFSPTNSAFVHCANCGQAIEHQAKFCGGCGKARLTPVVATGNASADRGKAAPSQQSQSIRSVPKFVLVAPAYHGVDNSDLQQEYGKLIVLMARERVCLILHWLTFFVVSIVGLWLAATIYCQFIGDTMTKLTAAFGPIFWINIGALVSISFVFQTKKEMRRLREKMSYVRFKLDNQKLVTGLR